LRGDASALSDELTDETDPCPDILEMEERELHAQLQAVPAASFAGMARPGPILAAESAGEEPPSPSPDAGEHEIGLDTAEEELIDEVAPALAELAPAEQENLVEIEKGPDTITLCLRLGIIMVKEELPDEDAPALAELAPAEQEDIQQHQPGSRQLDVRQMLQKAARSDGDDADQDTQEEAEAREMQRKREEQQQEQEQLEQFEAAQLSSLEAHAVEKQEREARDRQSFVVSGDPTILESRDPELLEALFGCFELLQSVENREVLWRYVQIQDKAKKWYKEKAQEYFVQQQKLLFSLLERADGAGALQHLQETVAKVEHAMFTMPEISGSIPELFAPRGSAASSHGPVELD